MPIKGSSYVGGLIGQIRSEAPTNILIAIENFQLSNPANRSQIQGGSYVGGMIGYSHKTHANAFTIELKGESFVSCLDNRAVCYRRYFRFFR